MHPEVLQYVSRFASRESTITVLDIGGRDINGTARQLFPHARYVVLDIAAGPNVDIVADAATWEPDREYDVVLSLEVFEHTASWPRICATARRSLIAGGRFIVTCAGPGRGTHSGVDGHWGLYPGEHYANVHPGELAAVLNDVGFTQVEVNHIGLDLQATAVKAWSDLSASESSPSAIPGGGISNERANPGGTRAALGMPELFADTFNPRLTPAYAVP